MNNEHRESDMFAPENVDEQVEQLLQAPQAQKHLDVQLVHQLESIYQEDAAILERARERLFQHVPETKSTMTSPARLSRNRYERSYAMNSLADIFSPEKRPQRQRMYLLAAGLVAVLIVGSLLVMAQFAQRTNTPAVSPPSIQPTQVPQRPETAQQVSTRNPGPWGITLDESRGFVYVANPGCDPKPPCVSAFPTKIGQHSLVDGRFIREFAQPQGYSNPFFVAVNPADGHVWFTQPNTNAIGELNPDTGKWMQYKVSNSSIPFDLIFDKNGNLWFTEFAGNSIGFLDTETHKIVETPTPTKKSNPYGITSDPKGNLWFTENGKGISQVGMFTPTTDGKISMKEFSIDTTLRSRPHLITAAPNGHIWVSEGFLGNITEFDPATSTSTHYKVASACRRPPDNCTHIAGIAADKQGNIWFTDSLNATVGYYMPAKRVGKVQPLKDPNSHPHDGLAVQSDGTVWFTEQFGPQIKGDPVQGPALDMWPVGTLDSTATTKIGQVTPAVPTPAPPMPMPTQAPSQAAPIATPTQETIVPSPVPASTPDPNPTPVPRK